MKNWKIGARLGASFAITLLLMVVLAGIGIWRIHQLQVISDVVYESGEKSTMATELQGVAQANLTALRVIIATDDEKEIGDQNVMMAERHKRLAELMTALEKKTSDADGMTLFGDMKAKLNNYRIAQNKAGELAKLSDLDNAREVSDKEVIPGGQVFVAAVKKLVRYQSEQALQARQQASDIAEFSALLMIVIGIVAVTLAVITGLLITKSIVNPLKELVSASEKMARGDLTVTVQYESRDEVGDLLNSISAMRMSLVKIIGEVHSGSGAIAAASSQVAAGAQDLSSRAEHQALSLEETASSMEELTSTVRQNTDDARNANQLADTAVSVAVKGGAVVSQVVRTMESINASSKKIVDIISVIDGIAFQTNILALNAAVEAARAGEQGRGFAVVAAEVRTLAHRSATAAKEIKLLIDDSVTMVASGSKLVNEAGTTMSEIVASIQRVTDIVSGIRAASEEQSSGIEQVNVAITQMDEVSQQNSSLVEQAAAAAESMQEQARNLVQLVSVFRLDTQPLQRAAQAPNRVEAPSLMLDSGAASTMRDQQFLL